MAEEKKPLSRSEREAKIKDKAGWVITVIAALLALNTYIANGNSGKVLTTNGTSLSWTTVSGGGGSTGNYVFDGNNKCIVLSDERFDDFVGVIRVDDSFKLSMYEGTTKLDFSKLKIQNIIERIDSKIYQPIICSFVLSSPVVSVSKNTQ